MNAEKQQELELQDEKRVVMSDEQVRTYPEMFYRLLSDSLYSGAFFKIAGLLVVLVMIRSIESSDWKEIVTVSIESKYMVILPWALWVLTVIAMIIAIKWATSRMKKEIDRIGRISLP